MLLHFAMAENTLRKIFPLFLCPPTPLLLLGSALLVVEVTRPRRGSNSLPGIPRMAVAIRRNPASPLDLTRFAQVKAASSPVLRHISKKNTPSCRMGCSFWSGRRGSNSLPRPWQGRALPDELRPQTAPLLRHLGASGRSRTNDTRIFSPLLYQLSYRGIWRPRRGSNPRPPA